MPTKYKKRPTAVRRKRRVRKKRAFVPTVDARHGLVPATRLIKLKYCATHTLTCTSGVITKIQYRANDIGNPYYSGTGHSPYGTNQLEALYSRYKVVGSRIKVNWGQYTANNIHNVATFLDDDLTVLSTSLSRMRETFNGNHVKMLRSDSSSGSRTSANFSLKKEAGANAHDESWSAPWTATPNNVRYFVIAMQTADETSSSTTPLTLDAEIEYVVLLSQPKEFALSGRQHAS